MTKASETRICSESFKFRQRTKVNELGLDETIFKVAETIDEFKFAYTMTHDRYVDKGYMDPDPTGMRISMYNAVPSTTTFIGKTEDQISIVGTLFIDSFLGLPFDDMYQMEADLLRNQGRKIAEIGSIASLKNSTNGMMHLFKIMFKYAYEYAHIDDFVITVNPKHSKFYQYIIGFEQIGELKNYSYVNDNPAIALRLDLHTVEEFIERVYPREPIENDIHNFFYVKNSNSIILPSCNDGYHGWNRQIFQYFIKKKIDLFSGENKIYQQLFSAQYKDKEAKSK